MTLADSLTQRRITTADGAATVRERTTDDTATPAERTILFVQGGAHPVPEIILEDLPGDIRVLSLQTDAGDAAALAAAAESLGLHAVHIVAWTGAAEAVEAYAAEHETLSVTKPAADVDAHVPGAASTFRHELLQATGYIATRPDPAPPTETIILKSAD